MNAFCPECGARDKLVPERWSCTCGGAWEFEEITEFNPDLIDQADTSVWRYRWLYGLDFD